MNIARLLVTKIVDEQKIKPALHAGYTKAWLKDPDTKAIFDGVDRGAYSFILDHYKKYSEVPDREQIHEDFDPSYEFEETDRSMLWLLDQVEKLFIRGVTDLAIGEFLDHFEGNDIQGAVNVARELIRRVENVGRTDNSSITLNEVAEDIWAFLDREKAKGINMGIPIIEDVFGGMRPGQLITFLGRNKGMKTWMLIRLAIEAWKQEASSIFFSVELSEEQIQERLFAALAEVSYARMRKQSLTGSERKLIEQAANVLKEDGVRITIERDMLQFTVEDIRRAIETHRPDIVFIDGFYFMRDIETGKTAINWEAHENLAADLKRLAEEMGVCIVTTTQVQEKQHNEKAGVTGATMAGGTGLIKASDLVMGVDKPDPRSCIQHLPMIANREGEPTDTAVKWDFETMTFEEVKVEAIEDGDVDTGLFAL